MVVRSYCHRSNSNYRLFLKRTINEADRHDKEIKEIQLSYVTKDELKDVKTDVNKSISKLQTDVEQIKDTCLTKKIITTQSMRLKMKSKHKTS